jgi:predicted HAD superfamily Cof-like phosphohydrolase
MTETLKMVQEFHETFGHPVLASPIIPDEKRCVLRMNLLTEELKELQKAIYEKDIVGAADALCDLQYVLNGAILEFGLGASFGELFKEVQRSNMSKSCSSQEEALKTVEYWETSEGKSCAIEEVRNRFIVYRIDDDKIMKSVNYSPANLKSILEANL